MKPRASMAFLERARLVDAYLPLRNRPTRYALASFLMEMLDRLAHTSISYTGAGYDLSDARTPAYFALGDTKTPARIHEGSRRLDRPVSTASWSAKISSTNHGPTSTPTPKRVEASESTTAAPIDVAMTGWARSTDHERPSRVATERSSVEPSATGTTVML